MTTAAAAASDSLGFPSAMHRTPVIVFMMVAAADGKLDKKEVIEFAKVIANPDAFMSPLLSKVLRELPPLSPQMCMSIAAGDVDIPTQFSEGLAIARAGASDADYKSFRMALLMLGKQIAEASGGGFFGFGKKIDKNEQKALAALAMALDLIPTA